jgi:rod shape-determining protein MreD
MSMLIRIMIVLIAVGLQVTLFGHWRPLGVMPDLLLLVVILAAMVDEATPSLAMAVGGGLLIDLASGSDFGLRTGFLAVTTLAVIAGRQFGLHAESVLTTLVITALATLLLNLAIVGSIHAERVDWGYVGSLTVRQTLLNLLIMGMALSVRGLIRDRRARVASELRRGSWL